MRQVSEVLLWRPDDRSTLSEGEIERFYGGNMAAVRWRPDSENWALRFCLSPGKALYQPPLAPHYVRNGAAVSVRISLTFSTDAIERRARIYRANRYLRRIGISPTPPGENAVLDSLRLATMASMRGWAHLRRLASHLHV